VVVKAIGVVVEVTVAVVAGIVYPRREEQNGCKEEA
jgi:hypothetical protein